MEAKSIANCLRAFGSPITYDFDYVELEFGHENFLDMICKLNGTRPRWYYDHVKTSAQDDACNFESNISSHNMYPDLCLTWLCDQSCHSRPCDNSCYYTNYAGFFCSGMTKKLFRLLLIQFKGIERI